MPILSSVLRYKKQEESRERSRQRAQEKAKVGKEKNAREKWAQ